MPVSPFPLDNRCRRMQLRNRLSINTSYSQIIYLRKRATWSSSLRRQMRWILNAAKFLISRILRNFFRAIRWILDAAWCCSLRIRSRRRLPL